MNKIQLKKITEIKEIEYLEIGDRPWGQYFVVQDYPEYKVKKIIVKPGQRLSLQSHQFRSEHWVVVQGIATVQTQDPKRAYDIITQTLKVGENCFIPATWLHRLSNTSSMHDLIIIEVQIGTSTAEDDITRYQDDYNR